MSQKRDGGALALAAAAETYRAAIIDAVRLLGVEIPERADALEVFDGAIRRVLAERDAASSGPEPASVRTDVDVAGWRRLLTLAADALDDAYRAMPADGGGRGIACVGCRRGLRAPTWEALVHGDGCPLGELRSALSRLGGPHGAGGA